MLRWPRCPICGALTLGVCCDVLMHDLDEGEADRDR